MDPKQPELTFDESVKQVMQTLPPLIRTYLVQGKYAIVARDLTTKYELHVDQGGTLERGILLLLMGIDTPDEFTQTLATEARLSQKTIGSIVQDINTQIFVPLREEEMKGAGVKVSPAASVTQPQKFHHLDNRIPPHPAEQNVIHHQPLVPPAPKLLESSTLLEDHEEPHIEFHKAKASAPPVNLPGAMPPKIIPEVLPSSPVLPKVEPPILPKPALPAVPAPVAPKAPPMPAKPYSVDPYREPIV